jgi:hypothetical protein
MTTFCECTVSRDNGFGSCVVCGGEIESFACEPADFTFLDNTDQLRTGSLMDALSLDEFGGDHVRLLAAPSPLAIAAALAGAALIIAGFVAWSRADEAALARCLERASFGTCHSALHR